MPDRLQWNIEADAAADLARSGALGEPPSPASGKPGRPGGGRRFGLRFWVFYALTLTAAAALGFVMGRFAESRQALLDEIERALAIEALAQRTADTTLLAETLDPEASPAWQRRMVQELLTVDASSTGLEIIDLEVLDADEVRVRLGARGAEPAAADFSEPKPGFGTIVADGEADDPSAEAATETETETETWIRRYRFVNDRWLHAPIEAERP